MIMYTMNNIPFSPTGFQTVYGNEFLDTLHNFFPEMMYDDTLFGAEWMAWMRARTQVLFPAFVRQQNHYNIYQSAQRRVDFDAWRSVYNMNPHYNPQHYAYATPQRRTTAAAAPPNAPRAAQRRARTVYGGSPHNGAGAQPGGAPLGGAPQGVEAIFTSLFNENTIPVMSYTATIDAADHDLLNQMTNLLRTALQVDTSVTVPTQEQIADATTHLAPPLGTECTICQETSGENDLAWRRINRCGHTFHDVCIQPWFRTNNTCPTCRGQL